MALRTISTNRNVAVTGDIDLSVEKCAARVEIRDASFNKLRKDTMDRWKIIRGTRNWTEEIISDIRIWANREFGKPDYYFTQAVTGRVPTSIGFSLERAKL